MVTARAATATTGHGRDSRSWRTVTASDAPTAAPIAAGSTTSSGANRRDSACAAAPAQSAASSAHAAALATVRRPIAGPGRYRAGAPGRTVLGRSGASPRSRALARGSLTGSVPDVVVERRRAQPYVKPSRPWLRSGESVFQHLEQLAHGLLDRRRHAARDRRSGLGHELSQPPRAAGDLLAQPLVRLGLADRKRHLAEPARERRRVHALVECGPPDLAQRAPIGGASLGR